ncbi:Dipeptidyl aminopeptidase [Lobulomyces angularis]|nr:Dipeptidyl aminopeptidase [Lobulomyces angularis]
MKEAAFGSWESPISSKNLTGSTLSDISTVVDRKAEKFYWIENSMEENVNCGGLYTKNLLNDDEPTLLTSVNPNIRFGDITISKCLNYVICIQEVHKDDEVVNSLVKVYLNNSNGIQQEPVSLVKGNDFYTSPRISPCGNFLAYLTWNLPDMPWEGSQLCVAKLPKDNECIAESVVIGGIPGKECCTQPKWKCSKNDVMELFFISDRENFLNIFKVKLDYQLNFLESPKNIFKIESDFCTPAWNFGQSEYDILPDGNIICHGNLNEKPTTIIFYPEDSSKRIILSEKYSDLECIQSLKDSKTNNQKIFFVAGTKTDFKALYSVEIPIINENFDTKDLNPEFKVLKKFNELMLDSEFISICESKTFLTKEGKKFYGYLFLPKNKNFCGLKGELPPLICISHGKKLRHKVIKMLIYNLGGPTDYRPSYLETQTQIFTSLGYTD